MTWATKVGVINGGWWATMWVMMWAMMWATRTMAAMMPAMALATMPEKGMAGTPVGRGGEALGGGCGGDGSSSGGGDNDSSGDSGGDSCILQGLFAFYC